MGNTKIDWTGVFRVISKYWRTTIGSLFALILAWRVMLDKLSFQTAGAILLILWVGGYVNRRIDPFGAFKKENNESANNNP